MPRKQKIKLTPGELEMMSLLWSRGPLTLAQAHEAIERPIGYTTVQTRLNRLVEKGVLKRQSTRPAVYEAAISSSDVSANHLDQLLERVTGGNVVPLVAHLGNERALSTSEIDELKHLIEEAERKASTKSLAKNAAKNPESQSRRKKR